jgi:hypothetical protein
VNADQSQLVWTAVEESLCNSKRPTLQVFTCDTGTPPPGRIHGVLVMKLFRASPAITSALSVRRLSRGAGQKPHRAVRKGVVAGQRQSPARDRCGKVTTTKLHEMSMLQLHYLQRQSYGCTTCNDKATVALLATKKKLKLQKTKIALPATTITCRQRTQKIYSHSHSTGSTTVTCTHTPNMRKVATRACHATQGAPRVSALGNGVSKHGRRATEWRSP